MTGLVGRDGDIGDAWRLLSVGSRTVCVTGDPGAGKSALLAAAVELAGGVDWQVVTLRGRPSEQMLPFAGVADLLSGRELSVTQPLRDRADTLTAELLGRQGSGSTPALALRLAVLRWLIDVAGGRPLLVVVDDQQWLDDSSWSVLSFVANRMVATPLACLVATRSIGTATGLEDMPTVVIPPLDLEQAGALLDSLDVRLDPVLRSSILRRASGNPLALREFARAPRSVSTAALSDSASVPPRVEAAFAAELPLLPDATRGALLLAAAGGTDIQILGRVLSPGSLAADLKPAETTGLVSVRQGRIRFRHPLARSTVYDLATTAERITAHRSLANAYSDDRERRTWHRAAATVGPDEGMAAELVATADGARERGALAEAAQALIRAAELSPSRTDSDDRMLEALAMLSGAGRFARLLALSERIRSDSDNPAIRARAAHQVAYAMAQSQRQSRALDALEGALEELLSADVDAGWASLTTLASLSYQTGNAADRVRVWYDRYTDEATPAPGALAELTKAAQAWVETALAPLSRPAALVTLVRDSPPLDLELPPVAVASHEMLLGATAWLLDEPETAGRRLQKAKEMMQGVAGSGQLSQTLMALGQVQFDVGGFADTLDTARSLIDLSEAEHLAFYRLAGRELLARATAAVGDPDTARTQAEGVLYALEIGECAAMEANLRVTLARAAFAAGDPRTSYRYLHSLFDPDGKPLHPHVCYRALGDLASSAVRVGQQGTAVAIIDKARSHLDGTGDARFVVILQRALALLTDGDEAEAYFELVTGNAGAQRWPFELAQAQLEYGAWLRRRRRTTQARDHLATARETFARIGAWAWTEMAETELRAAGVAHRGPGSGLTGAGLTGAGLTGAVQLTAQERQIVQLAAEGLTNREIGKRLFLSPRTVSTHLYHAFPKLGVTSRAQLRDLVDGTLHP